jgi:hypothetical protein
VADFYRLHSLAGCAWQLCGFAGRLALSERGEATESEKTAEAQHTGEFGNGGRGVLVCGWSTALLPDHRQGRGKDTSALPANPAQ